jgi:hypothetical protein
VTAVSLPVGGGFESVEKVVTAEGQLGGVEGEVVLGMGWAGSLANAVAPARSAYSVSRRWLRRTQNLAYCIAWSCPDLVDT